MIMKMQCIWLSQDYMPEGDGTMMIYTANQTAEDLDADMDDMMVMHIEGSIISKTAQKMWRSSFIKAYYETNKLSQNHRIQLNFATSVTYFLKSHLVSELLTQDMIIIAKNEGVWNEKKPLKIKLIGFWFHLIYKMQRVHTLISTQ